MQKEDFTPIKILKPTESEKAGLIKFKDDDTGVYKITFRLSAQPPAEWIKIFEDIWNSSNINAHVNIEFFMKMFLKFDSRLKDVGKIFPDIKDNVDATNKKYLEQIQQEIEEQAESKEKENEASGVEKKAIDDALDNLDYS